MTAVADQVLKQIGLGAVEAGHKIRPESILNVTDATQRRYLAADELGASEGQ